MTIGQFLSSTLWGTLMFATFVFCIGMTLELIYMEFQIIRKVPKDKRISVFNVIMDIYDHLTTIQAIEYNQICQTAVYLAFIWIAVVILSSATLVLVTIVLKIWWIIILIIICEQIWRRRLVEVSLTTNEEKEDNDS